MTTTRKVSDTYIAYRSDHNVGEAAAKTMVDFSLDAQGLIDAIGAEILNLSRPDFEKVREYRNEVLLHFRK